MPFFQRRPKRAFSTPRRYLGDRTTTIFMKNASFHADWHRCYQYTQKEA